MSSDTIEGMDKLQKTIAEVAKAIDANKVAARITSIIGKATRRSLSKQVSAVNGVKWRPLNKEYAAQKKKKYGKKRTLERDGNLKKIISRKTGEGERVIGTAAKSKKGYPYPAVHQFGSNNGVIPPRPFMPFDRDYDLAPRVAREIDNDLRAALKEAIEKK
jgi:phage gpG-like protein